jgi:site-specific recombinase XerC
VGIYYEELQASISTMKQHLSALRCFFDRLVLRHVVALNPAAAVRGERYCLTEAETPKSRSTRSAHVWLRFPSMISPACATVRSLRF